MLGRFFFSPVTRMFFVSVALFAVSALAGYAVTQTAGGAATGQSFLRSFVELVASVGDRGPLALMALIFVNNSIKALVTLILGFSLGLVPFIFVVVNGLVTGIAIGTVAARVGPWPVIAGLVPHGIIEVPAFLLAAALGFRVGGAVFRRVLGKEAHPAQELKKGLSMYAKVVLPALLIASAIEVFVTPALIGK